jgi:hypothetical protein
MQAARAEQEFVNLKGPRKNSLLKFGRSSLRVFNRIKKNSVISQQVSRLEVIELKINH